MSDSPWTILDAIDLYQVHGWGDGFFSVNQQGHVEAVIDADSRIDLKQLCDDLAGRGFWPPLLLRFSDILKRRMAELHKRFALACKAAEYPARYYGVYPIKVNQQRQVVEEVVEFGAPFNWGLEAGSKPELHAILALLDEVKGLIVCNGYKDKEFIELALIGQKLGKQVFIVVEKPNELELILHSARRIRVEPLIGLRCRLSTTSQGLWDDSGGDKSKFGLSATELLEAINRLKQAERLHCLRLLLAFFFAAGFFWLRQASRSSSKDCCKQSA